MKIREIIELLNAKLITTDTSLDTEVFTACGSDMMSDVLAYVKDQAVLLTGLNNPQVVRTADMMEMKCVVFVRGKIPDEKLVDLAQSSGIAVLCTTLPMFTACGILYSGGLHGGI